MTEKLYYWAENLEGYSSDNEKDYDQIIEIKRLNFFIGKNNAGKSRFLRNIFLEDKKLSTGPYLYIGEDFVKGINNKKNVQGYSLFIGNPKHSTAKKISTPELNTQIDTIIEQISPYIHYNNLSNLSQLHEKLSTYYFKNHWGEEGYIFIDEIRAIEKIQNKQAEIKSISIKKNYVPILRGMRPITDQENKQPYIERTQKDYFKDKEKISVNNLITGECLYHELKIHLLGEPEQRDIIKNYEEKLSQYFFDNQTITLIPKHDQDVVNIKIGNDRQFPISELGDGLQQVIILTYEAFIKEDETHAFFIEEPELHMHAGMVRQLMNFYLNETNHYYFFTTHSNHLLDMADESDQVIIQKFVKEPNKEDSTKFDFKIKRCDRDRDLLASLGVKPSSVYLANCTIWVEGITDRLYITKYMEKYLAELENSDEELYKKYRRFMPNYHYTFVEYAGSNLTHWSFSDDYADHLDDKGLSAKAVASEMLLIADGDIKTKPERVIALQKELKKENYYILKCKETENTLPKDTIINVAKSKFSRLKDETTKSYDILLIDHITDNSYFDHDEFGIGKLLDQAIKKPASKTTKTAFADGQGVGTIKYKLNFCREVIKYFDENPAWQLTPKAQELCERIFEHIEKCNS